MLQHKRLFAGMLAATMTLSLTACGSKTADKDAGGASAGVDPNRAAASGSKELTDWEKSSGILTPTRPTRNSMSSPNKRARSPSIRSPSRCTKVAEAFMKKYPGVECEPFDISTNELLER